MPFDHHNPFQVTQLVAFTPAADNLRYVFEKLTEMTDTRLSESKRIAIAAELAEREDLRPLFSRMGDIFRDVSNRRTDTQSTT